MRTGFRSEQLNDPSLRAAEKSLRKCVHCGICTATCPTYVLLGDERDSPRGRIVLIQNMLEGGGRPSRETVRHLDRCLSCLGCRTACPSGVDYADLIDTARVHIARSYKRPLRERLFRAFVLRVLMHPLLFVFFARLGRALAPIAVRFPGRVGEMAHKAPVIPKLDTLHQRVPDTSPQADRVALLEGCVQRTLAPQIDAAIRRVLARHDMRVEPLGGAGCCGSLAFHMGNKALAQKCARRVIAAFEREERRHAFKAVMIGATGCTAFLKDYGRLFAGDTAWETQAARFAAKVRDFVELAEPPQEVTASHAPPGLRIAYHPPCSLQHGQRLHGLGEHLLSAAGFRLVAFADAHMCCGSAGSYSLLQPEIAGALRRAKIDAIKVGAADVIASGNAGCLAHLSGSDSLPAAHIAELLDWAAGGPQPIALRDG